MVLVQELSLIIIPGPTHYANYFGINIFGTYFSNQYYMVVSILSLNISSSEHTVDPSESNLICSMGSTIEKIMWYIPSFYISK